jgi:heme exporter protein A
VIVMADPSRETAAAAVEATMQTAAAVKTVRVCKSIDERAILRDVSIEIAAGQFVTLLGANGTGKSTLLKIHTTLIPPSAGEVELFGRKAIATSSDLRRRIGLIGQDSMLYRDLSARENLEFFGRLYDLADPAARAKQMLAMIGLSDRSNDPVRTFSRGMVQRVAIARALLHDPQLVLADEPFAGLDAPSIEALEHLLDDLNRAGKTIVLVNHDIEQSLRIADHAIVLRGGTVVVDQPTHRLYAKEVLAEVRS